MEAVIAQAFETVPMGPSAGLGTTLDTVRDDTEDTYSQDICILGTFSCIFIN